MPARDTSMVVMQQPTEEPRDTGVWSLPAKEPNESMAFAVHDAKNLLGALRANLHWLRSNFEAGPTEQPDVMQAVDDMDTCCQRLSTLLGEALLAARGQQLVLNPSSVHVGT